MLAEQLNENVEHLEAQLAHAVKDANGTSYNRAVFIKQRRAIMQRWADYLDGIKGKATKPIRSSGGNKKPKKY
jgi:hypothetical protein